VRSFLSISAKAALPIAKTPGRRRREAHRYWRDGNGNIDWSFAQLWYLPNPPQAQAIGGFLILSDKNHFKCASGEVRLRRGSEPLP
jgi:hypothetical protein